MKLKIYQIDAFTDKLFSGNPAAVCPLEGWLPENILQNIAAENNLAETAFYVKHNGEFDIKWFTPTTEVSLCGHATLASAWVIFNYTEYGKDKIIFQSKSGELTVKKENGLLTLNFPAGKIEKIQTPQIIIEALNTTPIETYRSQASHMIVLNSQNEVEQLKPDFQTILKLDSEGLIVTAQGDQADFVSRCFFPKMGIDEDPVTGSAHTTMTSYWAQKLGKNELTAIQLSKRRGELKCKFLNDRVEISGKAKTYLIGEIEIGPLQNF